MQWTLLLNFVLIDSMISEKNIKNIPCPSWNRWASCFFCVILINNKKIFLENCPMNIPINLGSNYHSDLKY
jgi:hypothetical protein